VDTLKNRKRKLWTDSEINFIKSNYQELSYIDIARYFGRTVLSVYGIAHKLNIRKPVYPWNKNAAGTGICKSNSGSFKKNHKSWNLGTKGICKGSSTSFKKGHIPKNTSFDGCIRIRKTNTGRPYKYYRVSKMKWILYHVKIWNDTYGPVPPGCIIVFINGNSMDCRIENLEMITKTENMRRNTIQRYPEDLRKVMQVLGKLKHSINEKDKSE
jgi:hypothetical protein